MRKLWLVALLFSLASWLGPGSASFAQQDPGSLLGTIINEAVRQGARPADDSPYYGYDPQDPDDYYNDRHYDTRQGRRVTCESRSGQYNYCRTNIRGRIRLDRQLSDAPCRKYDTWGADGDGSGIWVSDGCRAVFVVEPFRYGGYGDERYGRDRTFTCKSEGYKHNYCRSSARGGRIRLVRQLSDAPCREYETWGVDRDGGGVWVDQGCAAEFSVD
jgi:hypothetical protein